MTNESWALEVVKGKEIGRVFPVGAGPFVLGNAINGEPGIDLGSQEGASPRRMAARQAKLERGPNGLILSDLDSPGGTFVNRQRILSGQTRKLDLGDILQLGGVQLKLIKQETTTPAKPEARPTQAAAVTTPSKAGPLTTPYTLADGSVCRSWDDFLLASSKSWSLLRGELTSGKLESFLRANGHLGLLPPGAGASTSDERVDAWLGALPATRPSSPELDIHPMIFRVKATPGGGRTRVKLMVTNVGYRLLRSKIRVEPAHAAMLEIAPEWTSRTFATAEHTEIPIDVVIPDAVTSPISAFLVVESDGGARRAEVRLEPISSAKPVEAGGYVENSGEGVFDFLAGWSKARRMAVAVPLAFGLRASLSVIDLVFPSATPRESLLSSLLVALLAGLSLGAIRGFRKEGLAALVPSGVGAGLACVFFVTFLQALRRSVDAVLPSLPVQGLLSCLVWAFLGLVLTEISCRWIPDRSSPPKVTP